MNVCRHGHDSVNGCGVRYFIFVNRYNISLQVNDEKRCSQSGSWLLYFVEFFNLLHSGRVENGPHELAAEL